MDRSPDPSEPPLEYWADTLSEALDHRETERKAGVNDLDGRDEAELEKARKHMTHVAVDLQTKFSAIDVASLLIGAGIGTMLANFGRDIAIEYFRQVVDDLNALPQPGDAPRVN